MRVNRHRICNPGRQQWIADRRWHRLSIIVLVSVGLAAIVEIRPRSTRLATVPNVARQMRWIEFIRKNTPPGRVIACLPFALGNQVDDFERTTQWMYFGTFHGVPLVNGYSGFFPDADFALREAVNVKFPTEELLQRLADNQVEFLVVSRSEFPVDQLAEVQFDSVAVELVQDDSAGVSVYRLRRSP